MQTADQMQKNNQQPDFPFQIEDLVGWVIRRLDGTIVKFTLAEYQTSKQSDYIPQGKASTYPANQSLSAFCTHTPGQVPVAEFLNRKNGDLRLWVANLSGAKQTVNTFDYVIDGGDVISTFSIRGHVLSGDEELSRNLSQFSTLAPATRLLKIDWPDRDQPPLQPAFWVALDEQISGDVMTCCIGGHGRSGTSFVCLTLVNAPDYDAYDAIVHLRAVHCPRAVESHVQVDYINSVATFLGRKANAAEAMAITDYKTAFAESTKPTAVATRDMRRLAFAAINASK